VKQNKTKRVMSAA